MAGKLRKTVILTFIALAIVAIGAAVVLQLYRDSIAMELANRFLADSGVSVTDVTVESIGTDFVRFEQILLELSSGSIIEISGVSLPARFGGFRGLQLHIDSVVLLPGDHDADPPRIAEGIRAYLEAGPRMHGAMIEVDEILLPDTPPIHDLAWYADAINSTLRLSLGGLDTFLTVHRDDAYRVSLRALTPDDVDALLVVFTLSPDEEGYSMVGDATTRFEPLIPLLRFYDAVPENVAALSGTLRGAFESRIAAGAGVAIPLGAELAVDGSVDVTYRTDEESVFEVTFSDSSPVTAAIQYPSFDWDVAVARSRLLVSGAGLESLPVALSDTQCKAGIECTTGLATSLDGIEFGGLTIGTARMSADSVKLTSGKEDWRAEADNAELDLDALAYAGRRFVTPSIDASFVASNQSIATALRISTPEGALAGRADLSHNLARGVGEMRIDEVALDLALLHASETFLDWPFEWDVTSGSWRITGALEWKFTDAGFSYSGTSTHTADSLAGAYDDMGFVGLDARAVLSLESGKSPSIAPIPIEVALVDVGFPIEDIVARFTPDISALAADVESATMSALGGTISVVPFRYEIGADRNEFVVNVANVQLPLMVGLANLESMSISGSVSGDIPVNVTNGKINVDGGFLEADPPGGAIRYGTAEGVVDESSQLGIVTRTLRNFEFDELTSEVNYSEDGDLKLQMRLTGVNPDVDPNQPVILNLGVENNVPQMLRSLQATRSIEEILEKKLSD